MLKNSRVKDTYGSIYRQNEIMPNICSRKLQDIYKLTQMGNNIDKFFYYC